MAGLKHTSFVAAMLLVLAVSPAACFARGCKGLRPLHPIINTHQKDRAILSRRSETPLSLSPLSVQTTPISNTIGVLGGGSLLVLYHLRLFRKEKAGEPTWRSEQADTREAWAQYVRQNEAWLYAIQTLRNAITAQTFLATTVLSLLTVIAGRLWDILKKMPPGTPTRRTSILQFILVASTMLASAYEFLQSARLMTHAGFMFPVSAETTKVDRIMRRSQNAQWAGLRFLYLAAGLLSWIVGGSQVFLVASALLTIFFQKIDKVPEAI
jgi:uncharacterized membrane protein